MHHRAGNTALPQGTQSVALLIGPEGGLTETEVSAAIDHGFDPFVLGPRVLRTETAPIAALSILQTTFGDFTI
jgi:16S rRNA (uracil1498-N3)-methyltransferase